MYGSFVEGLSKKDDKYGFVNEIEIRIATGVELVLGVYALISILFFGAFTIPSIIIGIIWLDFLLKVFIDPKYSIFGALVRPFIKGEYFVGAVQKRFAWGIGLFLATFSFACILIVSGFLYQYGIAVEGYEFVQEMTIPKGLAVPITPPLIACLLCVIFMTAEAIFGYCVGCKIYQKLVQWGWKKQIPGQNCAGGVCEMPSK